MKKTLRGLYKSARFGKKKPVEKTPAHVDEVRKIVVFDFGSVLRVKTTERAGVIEGLRQRLKDRFVELRIETEIPEGERPFRKFIKPGDWKQTVGKGLKSRADGWLKGFSDIGIPVETEEDKSWVADFVKTLDFEGKEVMNELRELLGELKGVPEVELAVLSNHSMELYDWFKNIYDFIPRYFEEDMVLVSAKLGGRKPSPKVYDALLDRLNDQIEEFHPGFHKENVILIDNKEENCEAAVNHGIKAFHYLHDPEDRLGSFKKLEKAVRDFIGERGE